MERGVNRGACQDSNDLVSLGNFMRLVCSILSCWFPAYSVGVFEENAPGSATYQMALVRLLKGDSYSVKDSRLLRRPEPCLSNRIT